jgi:hypothetical protein
VNADWGARTHRTSFFKLGQLLPDCFSTCRIAEHLVRRLVALEILLGHENGDAAGRQKDPNNVPRCGVRQKTLWIFIELIRG